MPYIKKSKRRKIVRFESRSGVFEMIVLPQNIECAGDIQYVIAEIVAQFIGNDYKYQNLNDVMGALAGAQQEFYRKIVIPYEDSKIEENGGVYDV